MNFEEYCNEALKVKYVVRNGKRKKKWVTTKKGKYKVEYENGRPKEVRITAGERRRRKLGQRKGKLKRKAKVGIIELRRRKSFVARRNAGMAYNKKIPDIVLSRGPDGHIGGKPGPRTLHPANESYLVEAPHAYLFTDNEGNDYFWDFYSELNNDYTWLEQIVDIYTKHELISLKPDANNSEYGDVIEFGPEYLDEITQNLMFNLAFVSTAAHDFVYAPKEIQDKFRDNIPAKLFTAIQPYIRKYELAQ